MVKLAYLKLPPHERRRNREDLFKLGAIALLCKIAASLNNGQFEANGA